MELATGSPTGSVEAVNEGRYVGQAFAEGDPLAAAVLQEAAGIQAKAIVQAVQEAVRQGIPLPEDEPEILWVLGGGVNEGLKGTGYVARIQEAVNKEAAQANLPKPIVLKVSEMDGARRGLQGATAIARALAGMEERSVAVEGARELWEGMRSAAPELKRVVIGRSVVDRFPAIAALAGLEEGRFLVDEGAATVVRLVEEGAEAVRYYGGMEEGREFAAMAEKARLRVETHLPTAPEFLTQLREVLLLADVPAGAVAAGLEQFADYLKAVPVGT